MRREVRCGPDIGVTSQVSVAVEADGNFQDPNAVFRELEDAAMCALGRMERNPAPATAVPAEAVAS